MTSKTTVPYINVQDVLASVIPGGIYINAIRCSPIHCINSHFFVVELKLKVAQLCPTLCDPKDYTVHGILQARILEWVAFAFSQGSSRPKDWTQVSRMAGGFFTSEGTREGALVASILPFVSTGDLLPDLRSGGLPRREWMDVSGGLHVLCWVSNNIPSTSKPEFFKVVSLSFWVLRCFRIIDWTSRNFQYLSPLCNQMIRMRVNGMLEAYLKSDHCNQFYWGSLPYQ